MHCTADCMLAQQGRGYPYHIQAQVTVVQKGPVYWAACPIALFLSSTFSLQKCSSSVLPVQMLGVLALFSPRRAVLLSRALPPVQTPQTCGVRGNTWSDRHAIPCSAGCLAAFETELCSAFGAKPGLQLDMGMVSAIWAVGRLLAAGT